jgi:hypothetical protein
MMNWVVACARTIRSEGLQCPLRVTIRAPVVGLLFGAVMLSGTASAYDPYRQNDR